MAGGFSPDTDNYYVGKGRVYFKKSGASDYRHLGNVASIELTPEIEELDHFSSMEGIKTKDKTIVLEKSAVMAMTMEEWTADNLALVLLGTVSSNSGGDQVFDIFSVNAITGELRYEGSNEVGPKISLYLPNVSFKPAGALNLISDEWGAIQVEADILVDSNGSFGELQVNYSNET
jgi:hypothetical protein